MSSSQLHESVSGLRSLIGGSGISLDGQSVQIPGDASDCGDDVSSMHSSVYRHDSRRSGGESSHTDLRILSRFSEAEAEKCEEGGKETLVIVATTKSNESTQGTSPMTIKSSGSSHKRFACVPVWLQRAPGWLKCFVGTSLVLLVGAIVLVAVGLSLAITSDDGSGNSKSETTATETGSLPDTTMETLAPTLAPTLSPTATPAPVWPPTFSPTAQPSTAAPTQPIDLEEIRFYLTAGQYRGVDLEEAPNRLKELPTRLGTSFLVHMGDWNNPAQTNCDEASYEAIADLYRSSSVPVYFVVGDSEYTGKSDA